MNPVFEVYTLPSIRYVVPGERVVLGVDFAQMTTTGEAITDVSARVIDKATRAEVVGVVTDTVKTAPTLVVVLLTTDDLVPEKPYRLETTATYGPDDIRTLLTELRAV